MGLFTSTETTIMIGSYYLIATAIGIFFNGIDYTFRFTLTGAGDATASTVLSVIGSGHASWNCLCTGIFYSTRIHWHFYRNAG